MFYSILFPDKDRWESLRNNAEPPYFGDLNLDQIVSALFGDSGEDKEEMYSLFYTPPRDIETIRYRQDVFRDLDGCSLRQNIASFAKRLSKINKESSTLKKDLLSGEKFRINYLTKGHFFECTDNYCQEVASLCPVLKSSSLKSVGLKRFTDYLEAYSFSDSFMQLAREIETLRLELKTIEYCLLIKDGTIRVRKYEAQADESAQILQLFDKFKYDDGTNRQLDLHAAPYAFHIEAAILNLVQKWYPEIFSHIDVFCTKWLDFFDPTLARFCTELKFYLTWQEYIQPLRDRGLGFCYPDLQENRRGIYCYGGFNIALAKNMGTDVPVTNDFELHPSEQIIVVTGPNQAGKTTFAKTFGQVHHLAGLGYSVPGHEARITVFDDIYTHFEKEEQLASSNGKLQEDLRRLQAIFEKATQRSILIINEIFSSATLEDALLLGGKMMDRIICLGAFAVCVTFLDELASWDKKVVSMTSMVDESDPIRRTFKILRRPAGGLAYAICLADKHGLSYEKLRKRLSS